MRPSLSILLQGGATTGGYQSESEGDRKRTKRRVAGKLD